jgi:hypothetical protein
LDSPLLSCCITLRDDAPPLYGGEGCGWNEALQYTLAAALYDSRVLAENRVMGGPEGGGGGEVTRAHNRHQQRVWVGAYSHTTTRQRFVWVDTAGMHALLTLQQVWWQ